MPRVLLRAIVASGLALVLGAPLPAAAAHDDYANPAFTSPLKAGLEHFYRREFRAARSSFDEALRVVPDNTFALSFTNAARANEPGALHALIDAEEDAAIAAPKNYLDHVRLAFSYLFAASEEGNRLADARDEFNTAMQIDSAAPAAHVGLGILRFAERSMNRSKAEFLAALRADPNNVLAREYLGLIYQVDLRDPQRALAYMINVPNLVPDYADIDFHIGSVMDDLKQYDAALKYLSTATQLDPTGVGEAGQHGYVLIARVFIKEHKLSDARRVLSAAVANDTDALIAHKMLDKLKAGDYGDVKS